MRENHSYTACDMVGNLKAHVFGVTTSNEEAGRTTLSEFIIMET